MASQKSAYLRTAVIKHTMGVTTYTKPTNIYLALFTSDPTVNNTGTEVTGGSYVRKIMTGNLAAESGGTIATNADINFTSMPTANVTHWGIFDASTSGNLLYFGAFDNAISVSSGNTLTIKSGNATVTEK